MSENSVEEVVSETLDSLDVEKQEGESDGRKGDNECMHGEVNSNVGGLNEGCVGDNIIFKGKDYGPVFPKKKKDKKKITIRKRIGGSYGEVMGRSASPRPKKRSRAVDPFDLDCLFTEDPVEKDGEAVKGGEVGGVMEDGSTNTTTKLLIDDTRKMTREKR